MGRYIEIQNSRGSVRFGNSKPCLLSIVEGAGNINSNVITSRSPLQHGETSHGATYDTRTLLLKAGIKGINKADTDKLYRRMYRMLISTEISKIIYRNYQKEYSIRGRVTNVSEGERVARLKQFVIQVDCYNPFWSDINELKEEIALWEPCFEFVQYFDEPVELGVRVDNLIMNVANNGDVTSGMTIEFRCNGTVINPSLYNIDTQEYMKVEGTYVSGDVITMTTQFANLGLELNRNNVKTKILHLLDTKSTFLQLEVGDNIFRYDAEEGLDNLDVSVYHNNLYLGV